MPETYITWEPKPLVLSERMAALAAAMSDYTEPLRESAAIVGAGIQQVFAEQGPGWAPWSEHYAKYGATENKGILWQTGALEGSVTDPENYLVAQNALFWTGAAAPWYWLFHQDGTRKMPARPFVVVSSETADGVLAIFDLWIGKEVQQIWVSGYTTKSGRNVSGYYRRR